MSHQSQEVESISVRFKDGSGYEAKLDSVRRIGELEEVVESLKRQLESARTENSIHKSQVTILLAAGWAMDESLSMLQHRSDIPKVARLAREEWNNVANNASEKGYAEW